MSVRLPRMDPQAIVIAAIITTAGCILQFIYSSKHSETFYSSAITSIIPTLFVLGDDAVRKALAQFASNQYEIPKEHGIPALFGFGWLSYALSSLLPIFNSQMKMSPEPEIRNIQVMNIMSGYARDNSSCVLSRLFRDLEKQSAFKSVHGLSVTILDAVDTPKNPKPTAIAKLGTLLSKNHAIERATAVLQLLGALNFRFSDNIPLSEDHVVERTNTGFQFWIALIPWFLDGNISVVGITLAGQTLASSTNQLLISMKEKFAARKKDGDMYALMRGKGHRHVFIVRNKTPNALDLEDLASSSAPEYDWFENALEGWAVIVLAFGWFVLFLVASSLRTGIPYLLAIMTVGHLFNMHTGSLPRRAEIADCIFKEKEVFAGSEVMDVLKDLEVKHEGMGQALLKNFFPGPLCLEEELWWAERKATKNGKIEKTECGDNQEKKAEMRANETDVVSIDEGSDF